MPEPEEKISLRKISAALLLWVAGFLLTAAALHTLVRDPLHLQAASRSEKLLMLKGWHGNVFSAAFGSSHVHNGFDPRVFDRTLAGTPLATRSANLAIEGGSQSEQRVMALEFVKQLESPAQAGAAVQPCFVMLELNAGTNFTKEHLVHPRAINIYDWPTTRLMTHFVSPAMPLEQRVGRIGYALAAMGLHYANIGMVSNRIFAPPFDPLIVADQTADDRRGQRVEPRNAANMPAIYQEFAARPATPTVEEGSLVPGNTELIEQLQKASAVSGVSYIYFTMPKISDLRVQNDYPDRLFAGGREVPILNLARSDRFPQFYNPELWHDDGHLSGVGAQLFSTVFAEQLTAWYAQHGGPTPCGG